MLNSLARRLRGAAIVGLAAVAVSALAPGAAWTRVNGARVKRPDAESIEYRRSWGLQAIGADRAYAAGYTGRGVRIALVDCGVRRRDDLGRNLSRDSVDLVERTARFTDRHGAWVAQPLGSALNGAGTVGVAYNATLLEIRADMDGGYRGECAFWPADIARAVDTAVALRARIIILPVQAQRPLGPLFEAALRRAVDSGAVVVVAAGNDTQSAPAWPARYAADPRFARSMVVAGAAGFDGDIAPWSNRAGEAKARYVLAPGQWILTDCRKSCQYASGTSFAAPFVAGAIALMMEAHPGLSGPQAAERVLAAARPPAAGGEEVYGRGMLDLSGAFAVAE
ncbi:S8 family serine peptidase [Phenylobacterium sp. LjRoot219]|uniref:S8 family peptidase n=1 Tax=Phenylobacterium sp. LjRoot219 TaxID=3342283 RepID=UPI003ECE9088